MGTRRSRPEHLRLLPLRRSKRVASSPVQTPNQLRIRRRRPLDALPHHHRRLPLPSANRPGGPESLNGFLPVPVSPRPPRPPRSPPPPPRHPRDTYIPNSKGWYRPFFHSSQ